MTTQTRIILVEKEDMQFLNDLLAAEPEYLPWVHQVPKRLFLEWPEDDASAVKISLEHHPGSDPTGEGSAYQPEPGSDEHHPPLGYRLAKQGEKFAAGYVWWDLTDRKWKAGFPDIAGGIIGSVFPIANSIPANEGDSQKAESERVFVPIPSSKWIPGFPPKPYSEEWFFAKLDNGESVALKALPGEFSYDFKTADETYFLKKRIAGWMQNPDSEYVAFGREITATPPPEIAQDLSAEVRRLTAENAELRSTVSGHKAEIDRLAARLGAEDSGWKKIATEHFQNLIVANQKNALLRDQLTKMLEGMQ